MDPHRRFYRRFLDERQVLGGVLSGLAPDSPSLTPSTVSEGTSSSAASQSTGNSLNPGGIVGDVTSLAGGDISSILPSSAPSSATTSSTPLTTSSSSSTGSTLASASTSTPSTPSTPSTTPAASTTPTSKPASTSSAPNVVYTSSDGTSIIYVTNTSPASSATAAPSTSFLQNPSLEGGVFAVVGVVVLIIIFVLVTCTIRKRRRARLESDLATAITFDPGATDFYERQDSIEKHRLSASSSGPGHGFGIGHGVPQPAYVPQQDYYAYGQYPSAAYCAPSSNPAPYQPPSSVVPQPTGQGGANLTRKFSDRKPVPPLLPNPTYDSANAHISVPPQAHQL